ncbi:MAG: helix-turn-helix transcriptional regulator [Desulfobacteraceae bacterium]|nr:helix-turn-helix transcriptional regulator [Desulfobacteraceae bacterium]
MCSINSRIKKIRSHFNLTQKDMAKRLGLKWYQIKDIETGKTKASVDIVSILCEKFAINSDWLLFEQGNMLKTQTFTTKKNSKTKKVSENISKIIVEHQDLIKRFKNPERAKIINENLIELEELNDELLENIAKHIESSVNAARIMKGASKKKQKNQESSTRRRVNER